MVKLFQTKGLTLVDGMTLPPASTTWIQLPIQRFTNS